MALIHSKQLNKRFTGSFSLSGSFIGDAKSTASFGSLVVNDLDFTTAVSSSAASTGFAASAGVADSVNFDGNRRVLQKKFPQMISSSFNARTSGSITDFLNAVFFPNTAPTLSQDVAIDVHEFVTASHTIGSVTATDAEHFSYELFFATQSSYTDGFFSIHSGSGIIKTNASTTSSMNSVNRPSDSALSHVFPIQATDGIATTTANVFIRVTPNLPPKFRTTSVAGSVITTKVGNFNENTTLGTQVAEMFVTDEENDEITISPLSQSAANRFTSSVSDVSGGKRVVITTATASLDFETITTHSMFISASDEHHLVDGPEPSLTTLPIEIRVIDNLAPTMDNQTFTTNESSGSHGDNGLGSSTNSTVNIGSIAVSDSEGDTVTFVSLNLTSGSAGGNTSQNDPSNNPFQVTSGGTLQLKAGQFLNSDIFSQYKYSCTFKDNFNDSVTSGVITINILADPTPSIQGSSTPNSFPTFSLIESADSGSLVRDGSTDGRTGGVATFSSNETVTFTANPSSRFFVDSSGKLSVNFNVSGSEFNHFNYQFNNPPIGTVVALSGSITASNAFGTSNSTTFFIQTKQNSAPTLAFSDNSDNLNSNEARPTEPGNGLLSTLTLTDTESDNIIHSSFIFTDPSGQLTASRDGSNDTYFIQPLNNLSGSTVYRMTASITDIHSFRTGSIGNTFTIAAADIGTLGGDLTSSIIESETSGSTIKESGDGRTGSQAQLTVSYENSEFGSPAVTSFTSSNSAFVIDNNGNISLNFALSGSTTQSGAEISSSITFRDQYDNIGSGSIIVNVTTNNAPVPAFTDNSVNLNSNLARGTNTLSTITFSDTEGDTLNHNTFEFIDPSGQLTASRDGSNDRYFVQPLNNLSGSTVYQMTASIKDTHGFRTGTTKNTFTITQAPIGTMATNGTFHLIESAQTSANIVLNSNGRTGTQGDLNVSYSPNFGSAAVQSFTIFENDKSTPHQFITSSAAGALTIKSNLSGSAFKFGSTLTASVLYQDQYDNIGSGSISVSVTKNNPPVITLSNQTLTDFPAEKSVSGSFITSASFSDAESDTINFDTFTISGTNANVLSASRSGNAMIITANTDLSASLTSYQYSVTVKDEHGFHTSDSVAGSVGVTPMFYMYKFQATNLGGYAGDPITIGFGDSGGDDIAVTSASLLAHFKSGSIGEPVVNTGLIGPNSGSAVLIGSQSLHHLASSGSGHSTWRNFGSINYQNNAGIFVCLFPSSSATLQMPKTLEQSAIGSIGDNTSVDQEYAVFMDNESDFDNVIGSSVHYFSTYDGVEIRGNTRFGMIFPTGTAALTNLYHYMISSGSNPGDLL